MSDAATINESNSPNGRSGGGQGWTSHSLDLKTFADLSVRVEEVGKGLPIVFLHGLLGLNAHWKNTAETLARRARCLLVEVPLLRLRNGDCSVEGVTSIALEIIDRIADQPAVLVGNSFGGHVALRLSLDRPELVRALVLAGSSGLFEAPFEEELERGLAKKDVQRRPSRDWIQKKIAELFYDPSRIPAGVIDRAHEELSDRRAARAMVRLSKSAKRDHMGARLGSIAKPALVVWGRQDVVTPPRVAEEFVSRLPDARLHWLDRCGHAPMIEQPEAFTRALEQFIMELDAGAAVGSRQEVA